MLSRSCRRILIPLEDNVTATQQIGIWQPSSRIPALDGVRGLAILSVTFYRFGNETIHEGITTGLMAKMIEAAESGVDLFFVLSGFLITGVLLDAKTKPNFFKSFFLRRSLRIFPLYFVSLAIFLFIVPLAMGGKHPFPDAYANQAYLWTYLTNIKMSVSNSWCFGYLGHFWSLAVEEHFYLAWPLVVFLLPVKQVFKFSILLAILSVLSRLVFSLCYDNGVALLSFTAFRCEGLLFGAAIAARLRLGETSPSIRWGALFGLASCGFFSLVIAMKGNRLPISLHTLISLFCASLLLLLLTAKRDSWLAFAFELPFLRVLGKYSYAMYVFQSPIIPLAANWISLSILTKYIGNAQGASASYVVIMFSITLVLAIISWFALERPILRLRSKAGAAQNAENLTTG